jgi:2-polyprenyl-3-methyl-5-hydroxy-6-metoxy-1,4-benzoquinol methylase/uncharacterized membrane protein YgaE (UPF0421/DUF939 family)
MFIEMITRFFARSFVRSIYRGALKRDPDAEGEQSYTQELQNHGNLDKIIEEIANSEEAQDRAMQRKRDDEAELFDGRDRENLPIAWDDVVWGYRSILGREPDSKSVIEEKLKTHDNMLSLRNEFLNSLEFSEKLKKSESIETQNRAIQRRRDDEAELFDGKDRENFPAIWDDVVWGYRSILGREPDSKLAIEEKLKTHNNVHSLRNDFLNSLEFNEKLKKYESIETRNQSIQRKQNDEEKLFDGRDRESFPTTWDDVVWGYRSILGREPDSKLAIEEKLQAHENVHSLRNDFFDSPEFNAKFETYRKYLSIRPLDHPLPRIDYDVTPEQLERCLSHVKEAWNHLGITRPHHSVLTGKEFLPENIEKNIDTFFSSGLDEAQRIFRTLSRFNFSGQGKTCVEYGCGVGRVTTGLARYFSKIHAYDISEHHLSLARQHLNQSGVTNVHFHLCAENMLLPLHKCDFFYSRIVFQHNPPPVIAQLIENALDSLNQNGIAIFQLPIYSSGYEFILENWLSAKHALDMQMHVLPQEVIFSIIKKKNGDVLEVIEDESCGIPFISNFYIVRKRA